MATVDPAWSMTIGRTTDGGYVVTDIPLPNMPRLFLFASTTLDEALAYVKSRMEPK